jgi:hypothetical protein
VGGRVRFYGWTKFEGREAGLKLEEDESSYTERLLERRKNMSQPCRRHFTLVLISRERLLSKAKCSSNVAEM